MRSNRILGPVILITIGALFLADNIWGIYDMWRFWPVLLIVIGLVKLADRLGWDHYGPNQTGPGYGPNPGYGPSTDRFGQPRPWGPSAPPPPPPPAVPPIPGTLNHVDTQSGDNPHVS